MDVYPRIVKLYKWHNRCFCKNYRGKLDGGWKKCLHRFSHDKKIASVWSEWIVHPTARGTSCYLWSDTLWLRAFQKDSKVATVNFANSLSPPSIVKKVGLLTGIKKQPRDLKSRELTIQSSAKEPSQIGCLELSVPNTPHGFCGRKFPSLIILMVSVDISSRP